MVCSTARAKVARLSGPSEAQISCIPFCCGFSIGLQGFGPRVSNMCLAI